MLSSRIVYYMQSIETFKSSLRRSATTRLVGGECAVLTLLHEAAPFVFDRKRIALHAAG